MSRDAKAKVLETYPLAFAKWEEMGMVVREKPGGRVLGRTGMQRGAWTNALRKILREHSR